MEGNSSPSLHLFGAPLKTLHRELVVISTHDSLITSLRASRNTAQGVDKCWGEGSPLRLCRQIADRLEVKMQDGQYGLGLRRKLDPISSWMWFFLSGYSLLTQTRMWNHVSRKATTAGCHSSHTDKYNANQGERVLTVQIVINLYSCTSLKNVMCFPLFTTLLTWFSYNIIQYFNGQWLCRKVSVWNDSKANTFNFAKLKGSAKLQEILRRYFSQSNISGKQTGQTQ